MNDGRILLVPLGVAIACVVAACSDPFEAEDPSWMAATVLQADSTADYSGGGYFDVKRGFSISSNGSGDSEGERVGLYRSGEGRAPVGDYAFTRVNEGDQYFTGAYFRHVEGRMEGYVITGGWLSITSSSSDRVEGRFEFTAELYCTGEMQNCLPGLLVGGAPPVEVDGSFSVGEPGPMCPGVLYDDRPPPC